MLPHLVLFFYATHILLEVTVLLKLGVFYPCTVKGKKNLFIFFCSISIFKLPVLEICPCICICTCICNSGSFVNSAKQNPIIDISVLLLLFKIKIYNN